MCRNAGDGIVTAVPVKNGEEATTEEILGGKYEVLGELGRGGMGAVLKARHLGLNKTVAIKLLHGALLIDGNYKARFELEAKAGARLSHPNLVPVHDYGYSAKGEPYLVMEFVEGVTLDKFLLKIGRKIEDIVPLITQICKALRYLHESNIVHRDLKTSNILVQEIGEERYVRLLDLGIVKVFTETGETGVKLTSTGAVFGSPAYMSPEQCQGQKVDARSDVYSMGCVLYECLTGELPFTAENSFQMMVAQVSQQPANLPYKTQREYEYKLIVDKCLDKDPAKRFQSARELSDALTALLSKPANQKARTNNLSRSYGEDTSAGRPTGNVILYGLSGLFAVVCVVALTYAVCNNMYSNSNTQATTSPSNPEFAKKAAEDKAASGKALMEKAAAQRAAIEKLAIEKAAENLAQQKAAAQASAAAAAKLPAATLPPAAPQMMPGLGTSPPVPVGTIPPVAAVIPGMQKPGAGSSPVPATIPGINGSPVPNPAASSNSALPFGMPPQMPAGLPGGVFPAQNGLSPQELAAYTERTKALARACDERYRQTQESLRAFDQSTEMMRRGNDSLKRYNDEMARQNGLGR